MLDLNFRSSGKTKICETVELGENKPHPVGSLAALSQFGEDMAVNPFLGLDETGKVAGVAGFIGCSHDGYLFTYLTLK